jgi:hypothetical protein
MCVGPYRGCYDPVLLKVFRHLIQPFPIGAKLKLTDGRTAVVVRYNRKEPFQPNAIVAFDAEGERLPADQLQPAFNIGADNAVRMASFDGEDLGYLYECPPELPADPLPRVRADLMALAYP